MEHPRTPSIHSPDQDEQETAVIRVLQRLDALQRFVRKCCFGKNFCPEKLAELRSLADNVDCARAASNYLGDLSSTEEEIELGCLEDPVLRDAMLTLEEHVGRERGRHSSRVDFAAFGITKEAA
ncbi:hypothetical protein AUJ46_05370 [Candidatus Peregrinibacteria bacterium CG1_02_54_53]|nr:MAG: hypothetical protein AUJ46_05370 [Candidatus Peregrinibacteria bacterium CG1_02_54_53]